MDDIITSIAADQSSGLVSLVLSRTADEIHLTLNLKDDLKSLGIQLKKLQMIMYGEQSAIALRRNPLIRDWLADVKSIAYEADDLLDDYAWESFRLSLPQEKSTECFISFLEYISSLIDPIIFRCNMAHRVRDLRISIEATYKDAQVLGIKPADLTERATSRELTRFTTMTDNIGRLQLEREHPNASDIIGRDDDIDHIVNTICDSNNMVAGGMHLVAVVGTAGLGKTSLLKSVLKHTKVGTCFKEHVVWICVSYHFNPRDFLDKMAEQLLGEYNISDHHAILKKLNNHLKGKSYLIILDDVWNTMTNRLWETVVSWIKEMCDPSRNPTILTTTRSHEVAKLMLSRSTSSLIYSLQGLKEDDSWSLFYRRVIVDKNMEDASRRMVKRCKGVPLAIQVLASTLNGKTNEEWDEIEQSKIWYLNDDEGIMPSLRLSFDYLPNMAIKRCFEYCAIFEEDAEIERENLIQLWVAQGLIEPSQDDQKVSLECIGDRYFNILLNSSLFQDVVEDNCGSVRSCKMHDAVWALAQQISKAGWLTLNQVVKDLNSDSKASHVRLASEPNLNQIKPNKKVRTMIVMPNTCSSVMLNDIIECVKNLRVLCLIEMGLVVLPTTISDLKHLRYLDISKNEFIELPLNVVNNLWSLQTLRCIQLGLKFPKDFEWNKLVSLRHIVLGKDLTLPIHKAMNQMSTLQTVPRLCLIDAPGTINDLGPLTNIRGGLELQGLEEVKSEGEATEAKLGEKNNICELRLIWTKRQCASDNEEHILQALQPHRNLKSCHIENYLGKELPKWLIKMEAFGGFIFSSLVCLEFIGCVNIEALLFSVIIKTLKNLKVGGCQRLTWMNVSCFPSLVELRIANCGKLSSILTSTILGALRSFEVRNCDNLTHMDVRYFPSLEELTLQCTSFYMPIESIFFAVLKKLMIYWGVTDINLDLFPSLEELTIFSIHGLTRISTSSMVHRVLKTLDIVRCNSLTGIDISLFPSLVELRIKDCPKLSYISRNGFQCCTKLQSLRILHCSSLVSIPDLKPLQNLQDLCIRYCSGMKSKITGIKDLPNLKSLTLARFNECFDCFPLEEKLNPFIFPLFSTSLTSLDLYGWKNLVSLPEMFQYCTALQYLIISEFCDLEALPEWFVKLESLRCLVLWDLPRLKSLPSRNKTKFQDIIAVEVLGCPLLPRDIPGYSFTE